MDWSKKNLKQIESLFEQSARGIHLLFDHKTLAQILANPTEDLDFFTFENINRVQSLLGEFIEQKTLNEKHAYIRRLDSEAYELLVRTYFNIVENSMMESTQIRH